MAKLVWHEPRCSDFAFLIWALCRQNGGWHHGFRDRNPRKVLIDERQKVCLRIQRALGRLNVTKSDRTELWLGKISNEIQERLRVSPIEGRRARLARCAAGMAVSRLTLARSKADFSAGGACRDGRRGPGAHCARENVNGCNNPNSDWAGTEEGFQSGLGKERRA